MIKTNYFKTYGKIIANVATTDTYNAGIVTVYNGDGVAVYMADADFSKESSVVYTIPEGAPESNYTFEVTVSNAEGKTKKEKQFTRTIKHSSL